MINLKLAPFLKWPGGKRWFINRFMDIFPSQFNRYYEPFIGGGSVYFKLAPIKATISDINNDLINLYIVMRDNPDKLAYALKIHQENHSKEYYYKIRRFESNNAVEKASHFLYLNRTCYNGMYRVNKQGVFNVPIGTKNNCIYDLDLFVKYSSALRNTKILNSDFSYVIQKAKETDLIFADPPYTIAHNQNSFIKYNEKLFTWTDQKRLLEELTNARNRGVYIISTNANYRDISDMYLDQKFYVNVIKRHSTIAGNAVKRSITEELLITSFPNLL